MFALLAVLAFVVALFERSVGEVDLAILGLAFMATHWLFNISLTPWRTR